MAAVMRASFLRSACARAFSNSASPPGYVVMHYTYVSDMLERRQPFRKAHFEHWRADIESGALRLAGAYDPVDGALLVFYGKTKAYLEERARSDPYCLAGLVSSISTADWTVVAGQDMKAPDPA